MELLSIFLLALFMPLLAHANDKIVFYQPEQIHIALGETADSMVVTWSTWNTTDSIAHFGVNPSSMTSEAKGSSFIFEDGGSAKRKQYIHTATMTPLQPNTQYFYHVGSDLGWSEMFWFKTFPDSASGWAPTLAIFGDMGNDNAQSLTRLQEETQMGMYDAIIHNGDFAYDMNDLDGQVGDEFMNQIQSIAAYVPYMTSPGNHEESYNFSHYKARFTMPDDVDERMFFSFNVGSIHFISISTEYYYFLDQYGTEGANAQFDWLVQDLKAATTPEARKERPWIILFGHRPMYCSDDDGDDCTRRTTATRIGLLIDGERRYALEPLLRDYNVDLSIWAHEHDYERFWPVYDYTVLNGSYENPYTEPKGPLHIVSGSAGCHEGHDPWLPMREWTAFRSADYGYTRLYAHNSTHLQLDQVSDDQGGNIIDSFWIITYDHDYSKQTFRYDIP